MHSGLSTTRFRRPPWAAVLLVAAVTVLAACAPPPFDPEPPDGLPYSVSLQRNLVIRLGDGRELRADVYSPADPITGEPVSGPFPVIVGFTPYGKSGAADGDMPGGNGLNLDLVRHGYLGAVVDVPGTGGSTGRFDLFDPAEATAGAQVVDWAAQLPRSNGKVGMLGVSYLAIVQLFTAAQVEPGSPLKAIFPISATVDPYRDLFVSGGALNVLSPLGLLFGYGITRSATPFTERADDPAAALELALANLEQMSRFEGVMAEHMFTNGERRYDGEFWAQRRPSDLIDRIVDNGVAVHLVGGLYDVFQRGVPLLYSGLQNAAADRPVDAPMTPDQSVDPRYQLTFGPWHHGNLGSGTDFTETQLRWFDRWLKDIDNGVDREPRPVHVIEPGGDEYRTAAYPAEASEVERRWLRSDGGLSSAAPAAVEAPTELIFTGFGAVCSQSTVQFSAGLFEKDCPNVHRRAPVEPGAVSFATEVLTEPLRLAGPIGLSVSLTSSTPDSLLAVTVEDVAPDGTSSDITGGAQLGSLRALDTDRSWTSDPTDARPIGHVRPYLPLTQSSIEPLPIGAAVRQHIEIRPAFATVPAGHRLRIRVATSDTPHLIPLADMADLWGGTYRIGHSTESPSFVDLTVLPG